MLRMLRVRRIPVPQRMPRRIAAIVAGLMIVLPCFAPAQGAREASTVPVIGISAGMGVSGIMTSDIADYINNGYAPPERISSFSSAAEFFGAGEVRLAANINAKIEFAYLLKSYEVPSGFGPNDEFSFGVTMPTLIVHYLIPGPGYMIKAGGGVGYHWATFNQNIPGLAQEYHASGPGLKLEAEGNTEFDEHLHGYIAVDLRDDWLGELRDSGDNPLRLSGRAPVSMGFFSAGLKLGLTYYF